MTRETHYFCYSKGAKETDCKTDCETIIMTVLLNLASCQSECFLSFWAKNTSNSQQLNHGHCTWVPSIQYHHTPPTTPVYSHCNNKLWWHHYQCFVHTQKYHEPIMSNAELTAYIRVMDKILSQSSVVIQYKASLKFICLLFKLDIYLTSQIPVRSQISFTHKHRQGLDKCFEPVYNSGKKKTHPWITVKHTWSCICNLQQSKICVPSFVIQQSCLRAVWRRKTSWN